MLQARAAVCAVFSQRCVVVTCAWSQTGQILFTLVFRTLLGVLDQERGRGDVEVIVSSLKISLLVPGVVCTAAHC